jgi:hypothetical protein
MALAEPPVVAAVPPETGTGRLTVTPRIHANRRQIDDRFPSLGFTIDTGGLPFFEVLLATDAKLFDPANAAGRTDATFYSSRRDGGLLPGSQAAHPYLVPSAVLRGFATAVPRPTAIFYTLITYETADGAAPVFAHPPGLLGSVAPSVMISGDFTGNTMAMVLSVAVNKLQRVGSSASPIRSFSLADETVELEDGYGAPQPTALVASLATSRRTIAPSPAAVPHPPMGHLPDAPSREPLDDGWSNGFQLAMLPGPDAREHQASSRAATLDPLLPGQAPGRYGRVFGTEPHFGRAQSTDFAVNEREPDYLADDEDESDGAGGDGGYTEDAFGLDAIPPRFQSLDDPVTEVRQITVDDKMRIIDHIAPFESGGDYGAINADGEFEGRFGTDHPAYQRYHVGLSYGVIQFTQDSGTLGELLDMMRARDAAQFAQIFGPDSDRLVEVTTSGGPASSQSPVGRSARVQPVGGADLWQEPWVSRFRAAGRVEAFNAAQRELAARAYLDPISRFAGWMGLDTERALTILVDRAIQMGVGGAKRWIASAVGPLAAPAAQQQALAALGHADLRSFQAATSGLTADGEWGPNTHAAMVAALRGLGSASPVQIPTTDQMVEAMVRLSGTERWHHRLETLRSASMPNVRYQL